MSKGGFGNLIALLLQKISRDNDNAVFIDESFKPYSDQWHFLSTIQRLNEKDLTSFTTKLTRGNDLGLLKDEAPDSKPWVKKSIDLKPVDFPETVTIVKSGIL